MKLYKLTDALDRTHGGMQWGEGVRHRVRGKDGLCSSSWLHAYESPLMAVVMDLQHARYLPTGHLWEAEGGGASLRDGGLKIGVASLTTLRRIAIPEISTAARVRWAILCAWEVCTDPTWRRWAAAWLAGADRAAEAAKAAARAA